MEMDGDGWRWMEMDVSPKCVLLANGVQRNQMAMACKERRAFSNESRPSALQSQPMVHGCANDQSLGTKLHSTRINSSDSKYARKEDLTHVHGQTRVNLF